MDKAKPHDYCQDKRTWDLTVRSLDQERMALPHPMKEAEIRAIQRVNHTDIKKRGIDDMRLILNGLAVMAHSHPNGHAYRDLYMEIARDCYYPCLDAVNEKIAQYTNERKAT
jgi:hypothetical protein